VLRRLNILSGSAIHATDGTIGHVKDFYFDDQAWVVRYLVVNPGSWLADRKVLISPYGVTRPLGDNHIINVSMNREQVKKSPNIDTHKPVSRQRELDYLDYYGYPTYWDGAGIWGADAVPILPPLTLSGYAERRERRETSVESGDEHLRSTGEVSGYHLKASDESIGHVEDFLFDEETWGIRYLIINTRDWWPGGKKVLVSTRWINSIEWTERRIVTSLTSEVVKSSAEELTTFDREFEQRLHTAHGKTGYWV
jgi:uncharacterized protein YrrD